MLPHFYMWVVRLCNKKTSNLRNNLDRNIHLNIHNRNVCNKKKERRKKKHEMLQNMLTVYTKVCSRNVTLHS